MQFFFLRKAVVFLSEDLSILQHKKILPLFPQWIFFALTPSSVGERLCSRNQWKAWRSRTRWIKLSFWQSAVFTDSFYWYAKTDLCVSFLYLSRKASLNPSANLNRCHLLKLFSIQISAAFGRFSSDFYLSVLHEWSTPFLSNYLQLINSSVNHWTWIKRYAFFNYSPKLQMQTSHFPLSMVQVIYHGFLNIIIKQ